MTNNNSTVIVMNNQNIEYRFTSDTDLYDEVAATLEQIRRLQEKINSVPVTSINSHNSKVMKMVQNVAALSKLASDVLQPISSDYHCSENIYTVFPRILRRQSA